MEEMKKLFIIGVSYIGGFNSFDHTIYIGIVCVQIKRNMSKVLTSQYNCLKLSTLSSANTCFPERKSKQHFPNLKNQ
jgi:hypothetical protein